MKKNRLLSILFPILIGLTVAFIWSNSLEAPIESQEKSQWVMKLITPFLELFVGKGNVTEHLVRKLAHFTEFGLLGCELSLLVAFWKMKTITGSPSGKKSYLFAWYVNIAAIAFFVAAMDETIQIFSGRGSSLVDVWLDFSGALTGIVGMFFLFFLIKHFCLRKPK